MRVFLRLKSGFIHLPPCRYLKPGKLKKENWRCFDSMNKLREYAQEHDIKTTPCGFCALGAKDNA